MALTNLTKPRARWATFKLKVASSISRSLYDKIVESGLSVKDFGAVGDGNKDDTDSFSSAISTGVTMGIPVIVPDGKYLITGTVGTISDSNALCFTGYGILQTTIVFKPALANTPFLRSDTGINQSKIGGFTFTGDDSLSSGNRKGIFILADTDFTRNEFYDIDFTYIDVCFELLGDTYSNIFINVKTNVVRRGWNYPTKYDETPPAGGNAACNQTVFERCRFRADDYGLYLNCAAVDVVMTNCIFDNRIGGASSYSVYISFCNTVTINQGYNESRDRPTFNINFPSGRGYNGKLTVNGLFCVNSFTSTRNNSAFTLGGQIDAVLNSLYFKGWEDVVTSNMTKDGRIFFNACSTSIIRRLVNEGSVSQNYVDGVWSGSNDNGYWYRYPDGLQMCYKYSSDDNTAVDTSYFGGYRSGGFSWEYPNEFTSLVGGSAEVYAQTAFGIQMSLDTQSATYYYTSVGSEPSQQRRAKLLAFGRWF